MTSNNWPISLPDPPPILDYSLLQQPAIAAYLVALAKTSCQTDWSRLSVNFSCSCLFYIVWHVVFIPQRPFLTPGTHVLELRAVCSRARERESRPLDPAKPASKPLLDLYRSGEHRQL